MQGEGPGEDRYCYCDGVSNGDMIRCDGANCEREWFHLDCAGLSRAPAKNGKLPLHLRNWWTLLSRFSKMVL